MTSRKPLGAGEIIRRLKEQEPSANEHLTISVEEASAIIDMLTPPPDAEVREAVEELERKLAWLRSHPKEESANVGIVQLRIDLDILLSYVRAVQSPRLTVEQRERLRESADTLEAHGEALEAQWLRAAFPEAFVLGEVERG